MVKSMYICTDNKTNVLTQDGQTIIHKHRQDYKTILCKQDCKTIAHNQNDQTTVHKQNGKTIACNQDSQTIACKLDGQTIVCEQDGETNHYMWAMGKPFYVINMV